GLGLVGPDLAFARNHGEQALAIYRAVQHAGYISRTLNNLSLVYGILGLYAKANDYAVQAAAIARQSRAQHVMTVYLDTLGRSQLDQPEQARATYAEVLALCQPGDIAAPYARVGLARLALAAGDWAAARAQLELARAALAALELATDLAHVDAL